MEVDLLKKSIYMKYLFSFLLFGLQLCIVNANPLSLYSGNNENNKELKTTVISLNLGKPHVNSVNVSPTSKRLSFNPKYPLIFMLENCNNLNYNYEIEYNGVNLTENSPDLKFNEFFNLDTTSAKSNLEIKSNFIQLRASLGNAIEFNQKFQSIERLSIKDSGDVPKVKVNNYKELIDYYINSTDNLKYATQKEIEKFKVKFLSGLELNYDTLLKVKLDFISSFYRINEEINKAKQYLIYSKGVLNIKDAEDFDKKIKQLYLDIQKLQVDIHKVLELNPRVYTMPIYVYGENLDLIEFRVKRTTKGKEIPFTDEFKYKVYATGGFKLEVSAGFYFTSLVNASYETIDTIINVGGADQTHKLIYRKNIGDLKPGVGTMLSLKYRSCTSFTGAFNIGTMIMADQKIQFLSGLGLCFGREERLQIQGGISLGSVNRASDVYKTDGSVAYDLGSSGQISTVDRFKVGYFFGFAYSLKKAK